MFGRGVISALYGWALEKAGNTETAAFLGPRTGKATVLMFNHIWTEPQQATSPFPAAQLAWGFPQACGGFGTDGVLRGAIFGKVSLAPLSPLLAPRNWRYGNYSARRGSASTSNALPQLAVASWREVATARSRIIAFFNVQAIRSRRVFNLGLKLF